MNKRDTMRARAFALAAAACFGLAAPCAFAQAQAYTTEPVDLFAGPSGDYPVVSELGPNVPVTVMGCVSDYSWCDVALPGLRGWVYANYLAYPYEGSYVPLESYGADIGLPVVTFALGAYWGSFYRDRPWYGDRDRWGRMPPPRFGERPSGQPPMHGGPQPGMGHMPPAAAGRPPEGRPGEWRPPEGRPGEGRPPEGRPGEWRPPEGSRAPGPQGYGARPPEINVPRQPAPQQAAPHAPAPQPQYGGRPPAAPPAAAYGHGAYGQPQGGQRAPGAERPQGAPQGERGSGQGNSGRNEYRPQN